MAPSSTSVGAGGDSPPRPPPAGVAEASAPSSPTTASTGDASGAGLEPSFARPVDALSPVLGAAPRSAADAPEAALGIDSADSQPQGSVSSSGASGDGARSAAHAPEVSSAALGASRFPLSDGRTSRTSSPQEPIAWSSRYRVYSEPLLGSGPLVVDLNRRPPLRTDYELDQRHVAAESLSDVVDALAPIPRSPAPWEYELTELRDDVSSLEARLAASEALLCRDVDLRLKAERLCNQASHERNSSQAAADLEQRCRRLDKLLVDTHKVIRHDREQFKAGISSYAAQLRQLRDWRSRLRQQLDGAAAKSGSSTSLTVDSDDSDDSGPIVPSALHKGNGKRPAKSSAKLQSAPPTPKKKQRLGRPSVDLMAQKAAKQAASAVVSSSGPLQSVPSSLSAASLSTSSAPISGIAVSTDIDVLSFASIPSGSDPPFSPIPRTPASPASSTASTASLPSTPVVSRGITPGTEASIPVEIDDDGGLGADGAASDAPVAPGGVFSSPGVSQSRRDSRPTRAASTTTGLRSVVAAENEAVPDALVLDLATPSRMPTATQASVASPASVLGPAESAAVVVTSNSARRRVANTHTGPIPQARVVATPTPRQALTSRARTVVTATLSTMPGIRSTAFEPVTAIPAPIQGPQRRIRASRKLPDLANPLLEAAFTAPWAQEAWCEILNVRIPQPIGSDRVTEDSVVGIQAFADWEDPAHPSQRLRALLPESPCTFGADDYIPDKPISILALGLAIVVKLWRQFTGRAVGGSEHSDLGFALWERAHWASVAAVEQWLQQYSDQIGSNTTEYLETEAAWRAYKKARNLSADRLQVQIPKRFWVWCTPDAGGKLRFPPEILLEPSMLQYSFETLTWAPSTAEWTVEAVDLDARQPGRNCWVSAPAEHPFNTTFSPCNPSVPLFVPKAQRGKKLERLLCQPTSLATLTDLRVLVSIGLRSSSMNSTSYSPASESGSQLSSGHNSSSKSSLASSVSSRVNRTFGRSPNSFTAFNCNGAKLAGSSPFWE
ncbi:unnamed protein product [Phytophthora fragariaefolia]|uniref:Unnamed protein product n=1 Tax=Phytophthora fragariaefolia TaxID=1490495 RepID=A0A9W6U258_9STRA|nr:unnamed protein product [Phytophthora fragariaefolia]